MKLSKPFKTANLVLMMIAIYLCVVVAGSVFINYAHVGMHEKRYINICNSYKDVYEQVNHVGGVDHIGVGMVFNRDKEEIYSFGKTSFYSMKRNFVVDAAVDMLDPALAGNEVFELRWFAPDKSEVGYTSLIYAMVPIYEDGIVTKVLCYVFEAQNYLEISIGYVVLITLFFVLILIVMIMHNRNIIRYEDAQKKYIDNVTHEMKTPVASIKALAEALSDNMDRDQIERDKLYGMILREANRQERMIKNILDLSKIQGGMADFSVKPTHSGEIFEEICNKYEDRCYMMDIRFLVSPDVYTLPDLLTNSERIKQLLDILLSNAQKFTDSENGMIGISSKLFKKKAIICVEDNGIGISEKDLPHICERFYRSTTANNYNGSGIGLAIAEEIVTKLKEKMWFESTLGQGTKVYFSITLNN